jgi:NAD(P)-dependent dehydrogenase (short-subunit alcohol dehydrogenase family)
MTDTRWALVTGAGRGLGREVCRQLAASGATVIAGVRDPTAASTALEGLDGDGHVAVPLDVTAPASIAAAVASVTDMAGRLDVLVNNAAAYVDWTETVSGADLEASRLVLETNLYGPWRTIQAFLPLLRRSAHPRVVNVASGAGSHQDPAFGLATPGGTAASYGVSKAALIALTSKLAAELADEPVIVNAVCPGLTATWPGAEQMGARPVSESAVGVVWAATLPDDGPRGGLFRDAAALPW